MMNGLLSIVVPIYNEFDCLPALLTRLFALEEALHPFTLELLLINDGSTDATAELLEDAARKYLGLTVFHFSRNFGHQAAVTAGLDHAQGDFVCIIDADLQDPPEIIPEMLSKALEGYDVVYAQRRHRAGETWFKKATAKGFYRLLSGICRVNIPTDTGDFRLMSRRVVEAFREVRETHRFIRGLVPWLGFRSTPFLYDRQARHAGSTKYPFFKMLRFAMDAIFSFSDVPLRLSTFVGLAMTGFSVIGEITVLYLKLFTSFTVPGISAVIFLIFLVSGVQFIILGMMGEYIGRIFEQGKQRPLYVVASLSKGPSLDVPSTRPSPARSYKEPERVAAET